MPGLSKRLNRPVVAVLAVAAIAGVIRFAGVDDPRELVFDETYYAKCGLRPGHRRQAQGMQDRLERRAVLARQRVGHGLLGAPPARQAHDGLGIRAFSMGSFGWRFTSALAGIGVAVFTALMAQLLLGKPVWTFVAAC